MLALLGVACKVCSSKWYSATTKLPLVVGNCRAFRVWVLFKFPDELRVNFNDAAHSKQDLSCISSRKIINSQYLYPSYFEEILLHTCLFQAALKFACMSGEPWHAAQITTYLANKNEHETVECNVQLIPRRAAHQRSRKRTT